MKNVLVYLNPQKKFDTESDVLIKIQIDNSLDLGWERDDIILLTNFPYQYNGVEAKIVDYKGYCYFRPLSTKTITFANYLEDTMPQEDELYFVHDLDAYQLEPIKPQDLALTDNEDLALTDYGWSTKWCLGSYFVRGSATDIFRLLHGLIYQYKIEDERALVAMTYGNIENINSRIKKLNISFQIGMREIASNYQKANKPLKVVHFHPSKRKVLEMFMYGKNELRLPLLNSRLIKIFIKHGIK